MATSSGLFSATIYRQSQLVERKHVARYWSIITAATAVPLSAHPSPLVITTKLAAAILGGRLFGGGVLPAQYCPCGCSVITKFDSAAMLWGKFICNNVFADCQTLSLSGGDILLSLKPKLEVGFQFYGRHLEKSI